MKILIACEESQRVTIEMRNLGMECYSCDLEEPSGEHPEWHILNDVIPLLKGNCNFKTMDNIEHYIDKWDLIIAHPPCNYLSVAGNRWFNVEKYGDKARERLKLREEAYNFFMQFVNANCEHIAIENPIGYMNTHYRKPDQIIQPYEYGHPAKKATCLWLKGLPKLKPTNIVEPELVEYTCKDGKKVRFSADYGVGYNREIESKRRAKTYEGIAKAMAEQWCKYLTSN